MAPDVRLGRVGFLLLGVRDLERSIAFYRDGLGLTLKGRSGEFAFLDGGGVTVGLRQLLGRTAPGEGPSVEVVFAVDDIDAAHRALDRRGVEFRVEPRIVAGDQLAADFRDPDGHVLSIFGPRAPPAAR